MIEWTNTALTCVQARLVQLMDGTATWHELANINTDYLALYKY